MAGTGFTKKLIITVANVPCTIVDTSDTSLNCTMTNDSATINEIIVTAQFPKTKLRTFNPEIYVDLDNDGIYESIPESVCPVTCFFPNCPTPTEVTYQDNTYVSYAHDHCILDNCVDPQLYIYPSISPSFNPSQADSDANDIGDACESDGGTEEDPSVIALQNGQYDDNQDTDQDGIPDPQDTTPYGEDLADNDGDGVFDSIDNCFDIGNENQSDVNHNGIGDMCDDYSNDFDNDEIVDPEDNCPTISNSDQADLDGDLIGDVCDTLSNTPPQVTSIVVPSLTNLAKDSVITVRGSHFMPGTGIGFNGWVITNPTFGFGTVVYSGCAITQLTSTELTCVLTNSLQAIPTIRASNPGGAAKISSPVIQVSGN